MKWDSIGDIDIFLDILIIQMGILFKILFICTLLKISVQ